MNPFIKKTLQVLLSFGLMALFLYWAFAGTDPAELWKAIKRISIGWIAIVFLTTLVTIALRAWRWTVLIRPFAPQVGNLDASLALMICYAANIVIPRSGEVLRCVSLKWTKGASISALMATVVIERILDLIWLIVFVGAALVLLRTRINEAFPWMEQASLLVLAGSTILLVGLGLVSVYREKALDKIRPYLERLSPKLAEKIIDLLTTFIVGLSALQRPTAYLEIFVTSVLLNIGYVLIIYATFCGMEYDQLYDLDWKAALVIMAISSIGVIAPTPGATGSYHFLFSKALNALYAVPLNPALASATLAHALATLTYLAIGGPALLWQWLSQRRREKR